MPLVYAGREQVSGAGVAPSVKVLNVRVHAPPRGFRDLEHPKCAVVGIAFLGFSNGAKLRTFVVDVSISSMKTYCKRVWQVSWVYPADLTPGLSQQVQASQGHQCLTWASTLP